MAEVAAAGGRTADQDDLDVAGRGAEGTGSLLLPTPTTPPPGSLV
jgi:hypothetical protein